MYHTYNLVGRLKTRFNLKEGTWCKAKWRYRTLRKPQKMFVVITLLCNYLYRHLITTPEKAAAIPATKKILEKRENETGMLGLCMERSHSIARMGHVTNYHGGYVPYWPLALFGYSKELTNWLFKQTNKVTLNTVIGYKRPMWPKMFLILQYALT